MRGSKLSQMLYATEAVGQDVLSYMGRPDDIAEFDSGHGTTTGDAGILVKGDYLRPYQITLDHVRCLGESYLAAVHSPNDPEVAVMYKKFVWITADVSAGLHKFLPASLSATDPYPNVDAMRADVASGGYLRIWADNGDMPSDHALAEVVGPLETGNLTINAYFRHIHDVAHLIVGADTSPEGELKTFRFETDIYGMSVFPVLVTETLGQLGAYMITGKFQPQKMCILTPLMYRSTSGIIKPYPTPFQIETERARRLAESFGMSREKAEEFLRTRGVDPVADPAPTIRHA